MAKKQHDNICDYDEAYSRDDAEEIGWCSHCENKSCPKNRKNQAN